MTLKRTKKMRGGTVWQYSRLSDKSTHPLFKFGDDNKEYNIEEAKRVKLPLPPLTDGEAKNILINTKKFGLIKLANDRDAWRKIGKKLRDNIQITEEYNNKMIASYQKSRSAPPPTEPEPASSSDQDNKDKEYAEKEAIRKASPGAAMAAQPNGGKRKSRKSKKRKSRKSKKRKSRKSKRGRKSRKSRRERKSRKSRKSRRGRKSRKN